VAQAADDPALTFLDAAGHPLRWQLLGELARSDRTVGELTRRLHEPQNLVSYHLGKLRSARLVSARRSSADGRDTYYTADLAQIGSMLDAAGTTLHPALRMAPLPPPVAPTDEPPRRVLFLCTGNSGRSQIAEALARELSGGSVEAFSAGSHPKALHPDAVRVMQDEHGIDISEQRTKHLDEFTAQQFDTVITLCDRVREVCPEFPGDPDAVHWSIPDPAGQPDADASYAAFRRTAADLETRVGFLLVGLATPNQPSPALQ
jgi:protein-tyrosine-phosphatase